MTETSVKASAEKFSANQWKAIATISLGCLFEFFDNFVIAFVLAFIVLPWQLSFGASAIVLLSSGLGGLFGALFWGRIVDRYGRQKAFIATLVVTAGGSLALAATPEGNWIYLASVRALIGFGVGGFFVPIILAQELVAPSRRGYVSGIISASAASGLVVGALSAATLAAVIGWRGLFLMGAAPALIAIVAMRYLPESPRWLMDKGRPEEARAALKRMFGDRPVDLPVPTVATVAKKERLSLRLLALGVMINFGIVTGFYGLTMWSPTLLAQVQEIKPTEAARYMILIAIMGVGARFVVGAVSDRFGRRLCGVVAGLWAALFIFLAALVAKGLMFDPQYFWVFLALTFVGADASFAVLAAYTAEIFPSKNRGTGAGISYAAGSVGKIVGPLGFALLMGSSNVIRPEATVDSILQTLGFVSIMFLIGVAAYAFIKPQAPAPRVETAPDLQPAE